MELTKNGLKSGRSQIVFGNLIYITTFQSINSKTVDYVFLLEENLRWALCKWEDDQLVSKREGDVIYSNCELINNDYKIIKGKPIVISDFCQ